MNKRNAMIKLLSTEGVPEDVYFALVNANLLDDDIIRNVRATDGSFYLKDDAVKTLMPEVICILDPENSNFTWTDYKSIKLVKVPDDWNGETLDLKNIKESGNFFEFPVYEIK